MIHPTIRRTILAYTVGAVTMLAADTKSLAAGPMYWDWPDERSFTELELDGAGLDAYGHLIGGLIAREMNVTGPEVFWRVVPDPSGGILAGTGHGGEIHRLDSDGGTELVARLEGTEVFGLLPRSDGGLLAGCGPEGGFYHVAPDGDLTQLGSVAGGYVWALAARPGNENEVWLAVGSPAAVYRYRAREDKLEEVLELPAQNALDLMFDPAGNLWVATQGPGLVYRLDPDRPDEMDLILETDQDEARQFITGPDGDLFVLALQSADGDDDMMMGENGGRAGPPPAFLAMLGDDEGPSVDRAALYRLRSDGTAVSYWKGQVDLMIAGWHPDRGWLAAGPLESQADRSVLRRLTPPAGDHVFAAWNGGDVLDLFVAADGRVVVGQAHPGAIVILDDEAADERVALSPTLDAGRPVRWGRLHWRGETDGGKVEWSVRGGNRSVPDESWSAWTDEWTAADHEIDLAAYRFLQWRARFPTRDSGAAVHAVTVSAWRDNLAPVIESFAEEKLKQVQYGGMGGRADNVTQKFRSGLQAEFSRGSAASQLAGPERTSLGRDVRVFTWQGRDPDGDRITYDLEYRGHGDAGWWPILTRSPEQLGSWDTAEVPDGRYELRLTARDDRDNPGSLARASHRIVGPVVVDNTPPRVTGFGLDETEDGLRVTATVEDGFSPLAGAVVVLPDGTRERLDPADDICDSLRETFDVEITWPRPNHSAAKRPWRVRVEVTDVGGNLAANEGELP